LYIAKIIRGNEDGKLKVGEVIAYGVDTEKELKDFKVP
jgi:hypothetical protein